MNLLRELVETGRVRTKDELRSVYKSFVKKYHPDSNPGTDKAIDFDELKGDYRAASSRLEELSALRQAPGAAPYRYDPEVFLAEFRDLVARGLPVSAKALGRNKAYAASVAYVSAGIDRVYGRDYTFAELELPAQIPPPQAVQRLLLRPPDLLDLSVLGDRLLLLQARRRAPPGLHRRPAHRDGLPLARPLPARLHRALDAGGRDRRTEALITRPMTR